MGVLTLLLPPVWTFGGLVSPVDCTTATSFLAISTIVPQPGVPITGFHLRYTFATKHSHCQIPSNVRFRWCGTQFPTCCPVCRVTITPASL
jgi:hypothetical protein